jgi:hypothetical protein
MRKIDYDAFRHWPGDTHAFLDASLTGPLYLEGSNLGLGPLNRRTFINVMDSCGTVITTHSIGAVLSLAEYFADGHRQKLLGAAALHYSLDVHALQGRHV